MYLKVGLDVLLDENQVFEDGPSPGGSSKLILESLHLHESSTTYPELRNGEAKRKILLLLLLMRARRVLPFLGHGTSRTEPNAVYFDL